MDAHSFHRLAFGGLCARIMLIDVIAHPQDMWIINVVWLIQAIKADALSLTAWQVRMYGSMAAAHFWIFGTILNHALSVTTPQFWFMLQIAMLFGLATSYPVNGGLVKSGIKQRMGGSVMVDT